MFLPIKSGAFCANEASNWNGTTVGCISTDPEFARKFTLSVVVRTTPLFENLTESFFFHLSYSARSNNLEFLPSGYVRQQILTY